MMLPNPRLRSTVFHPDPAAPSDRWESWWRGENRTPLVYQSWIPADAGVVSGKHFDKLGDADAWVSAREAQLLAERRTGDAVPFIRVDFGPVFPAAVLGAPLHFAQKQNTSWQDPILEELQPLPELRLDEDNVWWRWAQALTRRLAQRAEGRYVVGLPDLSGPMDILANLRGSETLCLDLFESREEIVQLLDRINLLWEEIYLRLNRIACEEGAGTIHWLGCGSDTVYAVPTCDFNALIGPADFREVCLPAYRRQAEIAGRVCFHLDGPDAARHAVSLAETPEFSAVQYTPGAGTPSALAKLDMFRLLQEAGKPLLILTPPAEVEEMTRALSPRGLALWVGES